METTTNLSAEQQVSCPYCQKPLKKKGLAGHLYYKHGIPAQAKQNPSLFTQQPSTTPIQQHVVNPTPVIVSQPVLPKDPPQIAPQIIHPQIIQPAETKPAEITTKVSQIELTPISRPVRLNAIVLLYYDEMRKMGYDGDLGDFITECVVDYFRRTMKLRLGFFREAEE